MKITIVDYGMGNLRSISSTLKYLGEHEIIVSNKSSDINLADKIILPGVGSFAQAMNNIRNLNIDKTLKEAVLIEKKPILGICLGMQLLGKSSDEDGLSLGLEFINGKVTKFESREFKIPHVGFNQVKFHNDSRLYFGINNMSDFYFTHSYKMQSNDNINQAICSYGDDFIASFEFENIAGVQFHPELSQTNGLKLLDNFINRF